MKKRSKYKQTTIKNMKFIDSDSLYNKFIDKNSVLVKIHDNIDFSFVNDLCDEFYSDDGQNAYRYELACSLSFYQIKIYNGLDFGEE